jgi:hypothetical protein
MLTTIVLAVYIAGVYVAFLQLQKWAGHTVSKEDEYQILFILSLLSWMVFPLYGLVWIIHELMED